jgi:predicted nucleotidyltransferase
VSEGNHSPDLLALASILADWAADAPGAKLYLFGSRVRGDHRPDSDVDVSVQWLAISDADMDWWQTNNADLFAAIDVRLPGKLQILEENDPVTLMVRAASVVH